MNQSAIRAVAVGACVICGGDALAGSEASIRQHVLEHGSFERITVGTDKPLRLADLAGPADLVVEASAVSQRSYLDETEAQIYTDTSFTLHSLIKNRRRAGLLSAGKEIVVRRASGTVTIDGRRATVVENDFPAFSGDAPYILFLKQLPSGGAYTIVGGRHGAFSSGTHVAPLATALPEVKAPWQASPRDTFLGELRALLMITQ